MTTLGLRECIVERDELRRENDALRALVVELGGDPDVIDLRDPLTCHTEGVPSEQSREWNPGPG